MFQNRWLLLRIVLLAGLTVWALREIKDPGIALPPEATAPIPLLDAPIPASPGDAGTAAGSLAEAGLAAAGCGLTGSLRIQVGAGLERADWIGAPLAEKDVQCLLQVIRPHPWPALPQPMELEWEIRP